MPEPAACVECGAGLPAERAELGHRYCTAAACQAVHHPGLVITTVGVNKSADSVVLAEEAGRRAGSGGLGDGDVPAVPDTPRLGITERLAVDILSARPGPAGR